MLDMYFGNLKYNRDRDEIPVLNFVIGKKCRAVCQICRGVVRFMKMLSDVWRSCLSYKDVVKFMEWLSDMQMLSESWRRACHI
jgi:hypothetical protein